MNAPASLPMRGMLLANRQREEPREPDRDLLERPGVEEAERAEDGGERVPERTLFSARARATGN